MLMRNVLFLIKNGGLMKHVVKEVEVLRDYIYVIRKDLQNPGHRFHQPLPLDSLCQYLHPTYACVMLACVCHNGHWATTWNV
jgi:hypothetical protein